MMPLGGLSIALLAGWKAWNSTYVQVNLVKKYSASANAFIKFSLRFLAPLLELDVVATGVRGSPQPHKLRRIVRLSPRLPAALFFSSFGVFFCLLSDCLPVGIRFSIPKML